MSIRCGVRWSRNWRRNRLCRKRPRQRPGRPLRETALLGLATSLCPSAGRYPDVHRLSSGRSIAKKCHSKPASIKMDQPLTVTKKPGPVWARIETSRRDRHADGKPRLGFGLGLGRSGPQTEADGNRAACGLRELLQAIHRLALSERSIEPGERPNSYFFSTFHITITGDGTMPERAARYAVGIANCPTKIIGRL